MQKKEIIAKGLKFNLGNQVNPWSFNSYKVVERCRTPEYNIIYNIDIYDISLILSEIFSIFKLIHLNNLKSLFLKYIVSLSGLFMVFKMELKTLFPHELF